MIKLRPYIDFCDERKSSHQFRQLMTSEILRDGHVQRNGKTYINFASNDYLGLSQHQLLIARAQACAEKYGTSCTASRLITGNHPLYESIESKLAKGKGTEAALVFPSGYQANMMVLAALADSSVLGKPVSILADRLSHNSLLQGGLLASASSNTKLMRFSHNDMSHLENMLRQQTEKNAQAIIVTESVFGMDGDCADLNVLTTLADRYEAMLYVDEAHATGVYGAHGFGLCANHKGRIDVAMGTFGKALGSSGAYVCCSSIVRDYLIQRCGGLIYSTALPPMVLGAIDAALDLIPQLEQERTYLKKMSENVRIALEKQGWNCGNSTTHIIPIILGDEETASELSDQLKKHGILVPAIRPPTVPQGTSRLRLSLSAAHANEDIDKLISTFAELKSSVVKAA